MFETVVAGIALCSGPPALLMEKSLRPVDHVVDVESHLFHNDFAG
jgi:hypothetical protein